MDLTARCSLAAKRPAAGHDNGLELVFELRKLAAVIEGGGGFIGVCSAQGRFNPKDAHRVRAGTLGLLGRRDEAALAAAEAQPRDFFDTLSGFGAKRPGKFDAPTSRSMLELQL